MYLQCFSNLTRFSRVNENILCTMPLISVYRTAVFLCSLGAYIAQTCMSAVRYTNVNGIVYAS